MEGSRSRRSRREPQTERDRHNVPKWHLPLHLGVSFGLLGGAGLLFILLMPPGPPPLGAWIAALVVALLGNTVEYVLHRWPMHTRYRFGKEFFRRHTLVHHRYFSHQQMAVSRLSELVFVLPSLSVILTSTVLLFGITALLYLGFGPHVAFFAGAALGLLGVLGELAHLAFHLPEPYFQLPIFRSRPFQAMFRHHALHHNARLMRKYNFNVSLPLCDWIFGSLAPKEVQSQSRGQKVGHAHPDRQPR